MHLLPVLLALALIVSGCASNEPTQAPSPSTSAAPPTAGADVGSITGVVVDEEAVPVVGATVAIVERQGTETETDAGGRFTFNDLEPGTYSLVFYRLGYGEAARKADVRAGAVTEVAVTLKGLVIAEEAYVDAIRKTAFFGLDSDFIAYLQYGWGINVSQLNQVRCDPCAFILHIAPSPKGALTEVIWADQGTPVLNEDMCYNYWKNWTEAPGSSTGRIQGGCLNNRERASWGGGTSTALKGATKIRLLANGGLISYQQKIDIWTSLAYNGDFPDDYTTLPPP